MRFGDERESSNFEDVTGRSGMGFGGGGGNALGCLLPLIASRFGIGGVIVLVIGYFLLSSLGGLGGGGGGSLAPSSQRNAPAGQHPSFHVAGVGFDRGRMGPIAQGPIHADDFGGLFASLSVGLRRRAVGDGSILLSHRQEDLPRYRILQ